MAKTKSVKRVKNSFPKAMPEAEAPVEQPAKEEPPMFFYDRKSGKIVRSSKALAEPDFTGPCPTFLGMKKMMKIEFKAQERDLRDQWMKVRKQRLKNLDIV